MKQVIMLDNEDVRQLKEGAALLISIPGGVVELRIDPIELPIGRSGVLFHEGNGKLSGNANVRGKMRKLYLAIKNSADPIRREELGRKGIVDANTLGNYLLRLEKRGLISKTVSREGVYEYSAI